MSSTVGISAAILIIAGIVATAVYWPRHARGQSPAGNTQPPPELQSAKFGTLRLKEVRLENFYAFYYVGAWKHPKRGTIQVVFHPPKTEPGKWPASLTEAEMRSEDLVTRDNAILQTGQGQFDRLFKDYQIRTTKVDAIYPALKLSILKLNSEEEDELVYAPCKWFPSFDLFISVNRDRRVTAAHFDG
ncbi:MAG TPA: hypothetical protein VK961_14130 [Chthoniobacter sp.]|nr:hypothetical protein [Chthoniobacter sp.]